MLELDRISPLRPESIRQIGGSEASRSVRRSNSSPQTVAGRAQASEALTSSFVGRNVSPPSDLSPEASQNEMESRLNELLEEIIEDGRPNRAIRVSRDEESGRFVYRSVDIASGEVIRQFPPEEILRLVRAVREAAGLVLDESA